MKRNGKCWTAPGSLLIAGEYLVTEDGGPGLCLATGGRAGMCIEASPIFEMSGRSAGDFEVWTTRSAGDRSLASALWTEFGSEIRSQVRITVDTGVFYDSEGRKLGYGSSAAAALLYSMGLNQSSDINDVVDHALRAHRSWQGGRGSGYDIFTSAYGGAGHFTGGIKPGWDRLNWPDELDSWILKGPASVKTTGAIAKYREWKHRNSTRNKSDTIVSEYRNCILKTLPVLKSGSRSGYEEILYLLHHQAVLGSRLGQEIGVPALPVLPEVFGSEQKPWYRPGKAAAKCLGAGNETILLTAAPGGLTNHEKSVLEDLVIRGVALPLHPEDEGLRPEISQ